MFVFSSERHGFYTYTQKYPKSDAGNKDLAIRLHQRNEEAPVLPEGIGLIFY